MSEIAWLTWGPEAFARATAEDKPVLLSIAASWCHWCHVMDNASYADPRVVDLVSAHFIPVRVDTDRRPDINERYNLGGWPTTAFLTPEGRPLGGGTYIPPAGFRQLLEDVRLAWPRWRETQADREWPPRPAPAQPPQVGGPEWERQLREDVAGISDLLRRTYDPQYGGFGSAPKFPHVPALTFALALYRRTGDPFWREVTFHTLERMATSGTYDAVEGGFFRYSTTRDWSVPHYEKMLEDNCRLVELLVQAAKTANRCRQRFHETVRGVLGYLESHLWDRTLGAFGGSQDADRSYYRLSGPERRHKKAPAVDRTIYVNWNARAASALISASALPGLGRWKDTGLALVDFLRTHALARSGLAYHYLQPDPAGGLRGELPGLLVDQVELMRVLLVAFRATGQGEYRDEAGILLDRCREHLGSPAGGFFDLRPEPDAIGLLRYPLQPLEQNAEAAMVLIDLARQQPSGGVGTTPCRSGSHFGRAGQTLASLRPHFREYGVLAAAYGLAAMAYLEEGAARTGLE